MGDIRNSKSLKEKALSHLKSALADNQEILDSHEEGLRTYLTEPYGNEVEGRSQVVMSDVADTIEWIMPTLMKIFYGGSQVVTIKPQGPEDEDKARLMEEKINFDFQRGINGYTVLHDWFKSALLGKFAVVKYWWEKSEEKVKKQYQDLNEAEYIALTERDDFEIDEVEETEVQAEQRDFMDNILVPAIKSYKVTGYRIKKISKPVAKALPPEEFLFDKNLEGSLSEADFCAHRKRVHKNYLSSKYKVKPADIQGMIEEFDSGESLRDVRFSDLGGLHFVTENEDSEFVYIYECYFNDYDKKGRPTAVKAVVFGDKVVEVEENTYGKPNFCGITTIKIPHRAAGRSLAEVVADLQKLHTALIRAILDNIYYQNNGITVVNPYRINMDDVIDRNEPGAKWRTLYDVDPNSVTASIQPHPLSQQTFGMLEMVDQIKENRTGVTKYNQGLDSKSLNKTATGISQIMGAAQQRMELIARMFAETGVKELFQAFVDMNLKFFDQDTSVQLNEEWVQINPDVIDGSFDVIIDVGIGTGTREVQINQLINMINVSQPGVQMGIVTPENLGNLLRSIYELMGYKNPDKFVTVGKGQQQGQIPPQVQQAMQQAQQQIQELTQKLEAEKADKSIEQQKLQLDAAYKQAQLALEEQELRLKYGQQDMHKRLDVDLKLEEMNNARLQQARSEARQGSASAGPNE